MFIRIWAVLLQCTEQSFEIPVNLRWKSSILYRYFEFSLMNFEISKILQVRLPKDVSRMVLAKSWFLMWRLVYLRHLHFIFFSKQNNRSKMQGIILPGKYRFKISNRCSRSVCRIFSMSKLKAHKRRQLKSLNSNLLVMTLYILLLISIVLCIWN